MTIFIERILAVIIIGALVAAAVVYGEPSKRQHIHAVYETP